jgi:hypothetical protein
MKCAGVNIVQVKKWIEEVWSYGGREAYYVLAH